MKKIPLILLFVAVCCFAQFTKVFEQPVSPKISQVTISTYAYDAENLNSFYDAYYAFRSGDDINLLNIHTQEIEYTVKISSLGLPSTSTMAFVYFYRNFFKSDGSWTCLIQDYGADGYYTLKIHSNGSLTDPNISSYGDLVGLRRVGGNLYMIAKSESSIDVYLVRNNLPSTVSIEPSASYMAAIKKLKTDENYFNANGQRIEGQMFEKMPDYLKKTLFE